MTQLFRDAHLLSGAYVLHALDPEERAVVEAAMADSEELRGEIAELSDTAVELGLATPAAVPSAALRARVLAAAASTAQLAPQPVRAATVRDAARPATRAERTAQRRWFQRPAVLVAAAAAAAVLFVGGGIGADRILNPPDSTTPITALIGARDVQHEQAAVAGGGTATVYRSAHLAESAVVLDGVSQPTGGRVLQVWDVANGTSTSLGVYPAGDASYVLVRHALQTGHKIAVTVEPAGGSVRPTTAPLVSLTA